MTTGSFRGIPFVVTSVPDSVRAKPCIVITIMLESASPDELNLWEHMVADTITEKTNEVNIDGAPVQEEDV